MNTDQPEIPKTDEATLESWKEIAEYIQRNTTTARRWERTEGLPVHRHAHGSRSSVYASACAFKFGDRGGSFTD